MLLMLLGHLITWVSWKVCACLRALMMNLLGFVIIAEFVGVNKLMMFNKMDSHNLNVVATVPTNTEWSV